MGNTQSQTALPVLFGNWWAMVLRGDSRSALQPGGALLAWGGIYAMFLGVALVVVGFFDRG